MGKPAARLNDAHSCPQSTGGVPHVGGPIAAPPREVNINGLPAACQGDVASCVGPPDFLGKGSSNVFIGGLPASRKDDTTAHGGKVEAGSADVNIGG